jgi:hypothetical protein
MTRFLSARWQQTIVQSQCTSAIAIYSYRVCLQSNHLSNDPDLAFVRRPAVAGATVDIFRRLFVKRDNSDKHRGCALLRRNTDYISGEILAVYRIDGCTVKFGAGIFIFIPCRV